MDNHDGRLPIEDGVEVISVGTSFLRFLEIAKYLDFTIKVVTDNDGDVKALEKKYKNYINKNKKDNIEICYDENVYEGTLTLGKKDKPFNYNTLEPLLLRANSLEKLNSILGTKYESDNELHKFMKANKTDCALKIFSSKDKIKYPDYIMRAIL
jgi:putative ATP-dependent endonuclease of OLD family